MSSLNISKKFYTNTLRRLNSYQDEYVSISKIYNNTQRCSNEIPTY